jgi:hypothetical protein
MPDISNAKKIIPCHPYLTFFTGLPVTLNTQLFFLGLVCMYRLPRVCIKNIFDLPDVWKKIGFSTDRYKKSQAPSPFTNNIVGV